MHAKDGDLCPFVPIEGVVAIGWLEAGHPFSQGEVDSNDLATLRDLCTNPWAPFACAGPHQCSLCGNAWNSENLFVPAVDVVFACPAMIVHYIEAHQYRPPDEFLAAARACFPTHTSMYEAQLRSIVPQLFEPF